MGDENSTGCVLIQMEVYHADNHADNRDAHST